MTPLTVEEVTSRADLERYRAEWSELVEQAGGNLFASDLYVIPFLDSIWRDRPMRFLFVREGNRLVGLVPFLKRRAGPVLCKGEASIVPAESGLPAGMLHRGDAAAVLDAAFDHLGSRRGRLAAAFRHADLGSPEPAAIEAAALRHGLIVARRPVPPSCVVRLDGSWDAYLCSRSRHFRSELKRKLKKLEAAGAVRRVTASSPDEVEAVLPDVMKIEERSWKHAQRSSLVADAKEWDRLRRLALLGAERGAARLHLIYVNEAPVGHVSCLVHRRTLYALKTSFDEAFRAHSPGAALFEQALRHAFEERLEAFEFLGIESRWKNEMATEVREQVDLCVFSRTKLRCRACHLYQDRLLPLVKSWLPARDAARHKLVWLWSERGHVRS